LKGTGTHEHPADHHFPKVNHWQSHWSAASIFLETFAVAVSIKFVLIFTDSPSCENNEESMFFGVHVSRVSIPGKLEILSRLVTAPN